MIDVITNPSGVADRVVAIGEEAVVVCNPDAVAVDEVARSLAAGKVPTDGDTEVIPLSVIQAVRTNKHRRDLRISYWDGRTTQFKHVFFSDPAARDRALAAMQRRFARTFRREQVQYGFLRAAGVPLLWVIGLVLFTWLAMGAAREMAAGAPVIIKGTNQVEKSLFAGLLGAVGPFGAFILGAMAVAAAGRWLLTRLQHPPLMVTLMRNRSGDN